MAQPYQTSRAVTNTSKQTDEEIEEMEGMESLEHEGAEDEEYDEVAEQEALEAIEEMVQIFGAGLQMKYDRNVALKEEVEQRWLDDLRHYNGVYDRETAKQLSEGTQGKKSKIFVNLTRSKCNTAESKWADLVLPTDDRNWGLKSTPVPSLADDLSDESPLSLPDGSQPLDEETGEPFQVKDAAEEIIKQAEKACSLMEREMDDQLSECNFNGIGRDLIHNAVVMGTGILKGPMVEQRKKKAWIKNDAGEWQISAQVDHKPTASDVDPWHFFPDMSATRFADCEFTFERHLMIAKQLRALAKQPGFMANRIADILESKPNGAHAKLSYLNELREISGVTQIQHDNRYEVVEYHGPVSKQDLLVCGCEGVDVENPLEEYEGTVWFCMGIVIKVALNHMDSDELPYDTLTWEKDDTCIFGFGVPYRMRDPQKVMNASWRMVLDNAGLSTGPQILINKAMVEPADGTWELSPRKIWWITSKDPKIRADYVMQTFEVPSHQQELTAIFETAHRLADEETSVPQMQMGNTPGDTQQPAMLKTLGGTALWMSSNNIMMRRAVKNFDDDILVPFLTRFYDWNMQFNDNPDIKGDFNVQARGTSVLLVREMQSRNIMEFTAAAMQLPGGPEEIKTRGVLKNMAKGMQIAVDEVMRTDDDSEQAIKEQKENPPMDPEAQKVQAQMELKKMDIEWQREKLQMEIQKEMIQGESLRQVELIQREVEMTKMGMNNEVSLEKIRSDNQIKKYNTDWSIKQFYEELKIKERSGETANYGLDPGPGNI